ncbi:hypothetical protein Y032_0053g2357 [Ancylostoma ceylanicum]|uniref:Uncharacterized protein n=1 Tax=Ancylostoma ceylanicum TaxID=53326 RepID=A0A016U6D9_9BILA|nr:hypothetical protein Y032_0053g2357 [Ancylostoma ceylanicum]
MFCNCGQKLPIGVVLVRIIVRKKGLDHASLIGAFGPPVTPTCLKVCGVAHKCSMCYGIDAVRLQTVGRDGQHECANQSRLVTPLFPQDANLVVLCVKKAVQRSNGPTKLPYTILPNTQSQKGG